MNKCQWSDTHIVFFQVSMGWGWSGTIGNGSYSHGLHVVANRITGNCRDLYDCGMIYTLVGT